MYRRIILLCTLLTSALAIRIPFFSKKDYTPLLFFKVPPGLMPECDAMEATVREIEKELGVRVERLDVLRQPASEAVLAILTQRNPPFLYHRESCQTVHMAPRKEGPIAVDKDKIRAWAKGRYLPVSRMMETDRVRAPVVVSQQDKSLEQEDLLEDAMLTPLQKRGKDAIKERTEAKGKAKE